MLSVSFNETERRSADQEDGNRGCYFCQNCTLSLAITSRNRLTASRREAHGLLLLLLVRHRQGGAPQRPFGVDQHRCDPHEHAIPRATYRNPFSACMFENRRSALRLFHSPVSRTLWTAARAFVVVGGGVVVVGAAVLVVVAAAAVVVGSGVVVVGGSGAVVVGGSVVTARLLASF